MWALITLLVLCQVQDSEAEKLRSAINCQLQAIKSFRAVYTQFEIRPDKGQLARKDWDNLLEQLSSEPESISKTLSKYLELRHVTFSECKLTVHCQKDKVRNDLEIPIPKVTLQQMNRPLTDSPEVRRSVYDGKNLILASSFNHDISIHPINFTSLFDKRKALLSIEFPLKSDALNILMMKPGDPETFLFERGVEGTQIKAEITGKGFINSLCDFGKSTNRVAKQYSPQEIKGVYIPRLKVNYETKGDQVVACFIYINHSFVLNPPDDDSTFVQPVKFNDTVVDSRFDRSKPNVFKADMNFDNVIKLADDWIEKQKISKGG